MFSCILLHHQFLIQRAAIHPNAHRLPVVTRDFANRGKLFVAPLSRAHISRIDAVFIERLRALRIFRQQHVPVVVEIPNDRHVAARIQQPLS